jgi:hypothetical protein
MQRGKRMSWAIIYNAILTASKTITSARLLLLLFLVATASLYFVTQSDPRKLVVAVVATMGLLVVAKVLTVAAQLATPFVSVLASAMTLVVLILFLVWLAALTGRALFSIPNCIPILESCDTGGREEVLAFACDIFKEPEVGQGQGDLELSGKIVDFKRESAPDLFDGSGPLLIGESGRLYFRNSEGRLWETSPNRDPDLGAGSRFNQDSWPIELSYTLLYTQFPDIIGDELWFALSGYSEPVGRIALGIEPSGDFVFLQLLRAIAPSGDSSVALRRTQIGKCQFS